MEYDFDRVRHFKNTIGIMFHEIVSSSLHLSVFDLCFICGWLRLGLAVKSVASLPVLFHLGSGGESEIGENLCRAIRIVDGVKRGVTDELVAEDGHRQPLKADSAQRPLLRDVMGEARFIVAFDPPHDGVIGLVHARSLRSTYLSRACHRGDVQNAHPWFVRQTLREDVLQIGFSLGQISQLCRHAARFIRDFA